MNSLRYFPHQKSSARSLGSPTLLASLDAHFACVAKPRRNRPQRSFGHDPMFCTGEVPLFTSSNRTSLLIAVAIERLRMDAQAVIRR
jgi:hypothetical protein